MWSKRVWILGAALFMSQAATVRAAELQILAGGGIAAPLKELAAQFEAATGHKLVIRFGTTPELIKMATTGGPFDVAIVPVDVMKDASALAKFVPGPQTGVARVGLGVAVRSGAPKPDISTPDGLKNALLAAKSVGVSKGPSGVYLMKLMDQLGIADQIKAKTVSPDLGVRVGTLVAKGEAEIGVQQVNELLPIAGIDFVGKLPKELRTVIVYGAARGTNAKEWSAAEALVKYLTSPAAAAILKKLGLDPA